MRCNFSMIPARVDSRSASRCSLSELRSDPPSQAAVTQHSKTHTRCGGPEGWSGAKQPSEPSRVPRTPLEPPFPSQARPVTTL